ncbi:MAG TPA: PaaI family thioesterase [Bradyrhizobium sp.]|jgi:acyl-coenzyme A thioesterase PaaI-like protein|nr:PaaI family thioesterase [Bradyrhizobium sp.]HTB00733.1 PaaI family thioesterase [Bradyrhizobium sp.]
MDDIAGMDIASKTYGTVSAERRSEMSGLEFVQGLADGTLPLNTIARTLGYDITEAASGRVVITARPNDSHLNPAGTVHGGFSATLLDSCMGLAVSRPSKRVLARPRSNSRFRYCGRSRPRRE